MTETFPWKRLMQLGLGTLRLSPDQFWRSSPREIAGAFGFPSQTQDAKSLRQNLDEMMERFPDCETYLSPRSGEGGAAQP